jgi:hypothetical protein
VPVARKKLVVERVDGMTKSRNSEALWPAVFFGLCAYFYPSIRSVRRTADASPFLIEKSASVWICKFNNSPEKCRIPKKNVTIENCMVDRNVY